MATKQELEAREADYNRAAEFAALAAEAAAVDADPVARRQGRGCSRSG
ncbi:MAG: hypothetical protein WBG92_22990 [Thiohalocapsa sp.]